MMQTKDQTDIFSVSEFAEYARISRHTLLFYEKIGLLFPHSRGENNYRFYSSGQLAVVNLIRTCQELGMTLSEIRQLKSNRTPKLIDDLLEQQIERIDEKVDEWVRAKKLLFALKKTIHSVLGIDEDAITVQFVPAEAIVLGELNDYSKGKSFYAALSEFYRSIDKNNPDLDLNYPVWGLFSGDRIKARDWEYPDRFYFNNPEGFDKKPAALYAIGYSRGWYGQSNELYERLLNYIDANGFEICGPAYEEYPLNEVCVVDDNNYLMRIMITVREKTAT